MWKRSTWSSTERRWNQRDRWSVRPCTTTRCAVKSIYETTTPRNRRVDAVTAYLYDENSYLFTWASAPGLTCTGRAAGRRRYDGSRCNSSTYHARYEQLSLAGRADWSRVGGSGKDGSVSTTTVARLLIIASVMWSVGFLAYVWRTQVTLAGNDTVPISIWRAVALVFDVWRPKISWS